MTLSCGDRATRGGTATVLSCALCGFRFHSEGPVCTACPLSGGCEVVRCPHCGYQFPKGSRLIDLLSRLRPAKRARR